MRTFIVKISEWGPGYLVRPDGEPEQGLKCCLGFACEQLGVPTDDLRGNTMPDGLELSNYTEEIRDFVRVLANTASGDVRRAAYRALVACATAQGEHVSTSDAWMVIGDTSTNIGHLMAKVNDTYHEVNLEMREQALSAVQEQLTLMFNASGYGLEFVP